MRGGRSLHSKGPARAQAGVGQQRQGVGGGPTGDLMGVAPTNRPVSFTYVHILRFQDGKAIERWGVRDDLALMRQLGVISAR
jgi:hypothetical protein